ncbi:MAG: tetratricopeptide repeat protein [Fuerstiella sp.]
MAAEQISTPNLLARRLLQERKVDEALALLEETVQSSPDDPETQELLGMACFMSRRFEAAKVAFEKLTQLDPKYATGWINLGAVRNILNDHHGATKALRKAIKWDKKSASAYYNLGIAQKALKMNSMAISAYKEALKIDPCMAEAYSNLGNMYIQMNNLGQAVRLLEEGVARCPQSRKVAAILQKARRAKEGSRRSESPLGRLVDEKELAKKQIRTAPRDLDAAQRVHERETLHDLGKTIRRATRPLVEHLDKDLQQQLHILDLAAAQKDARGEAPATYDRMSKTLDEMDQLRLVTKTAIAEVRAHLRTTDPGF